MRAALLVLISLACASHGQNRAPSLHALADLRQVQTSLKVFASVLLAFHPAIDHIRLCGRPAPASADKSWLSSPSCQSPVRFVTSLVVPERHEDVAMCEGSLLDFDKVVEALKVDTPDILHREPNWNVFAEDFKVYDQSGAEVKGLGANKLSLKMLRRKCEELATEDDISVDFILHDEFSTNRRFPYVEAHWHVRLKFPADQPLDIEAQTVFHLNPNNQADSLRIDKWLVNGNRLEAQFEGWTKDVEKYQLSNPGAVEALERETPPAERGFLVANIMNPNGALSSHAEAVVLSKMFEETASESFNGSNVSVLDSLPKPEYEGPLLLLTDELCVGHDTGIGHPESSTRLGQLIGSIKSTWGTEFGESLLHIWEPSPGAALDATEEQLLRVHSQTHVDKMKLFFQMAKEQDSVQYLDGGQTLVSPGSQAAVLRAVGLVVAAVDEVLKPSASSTRAFVAVRPPGHHAERDTAMGFCLFNNIMVGVAHAEAVHGKKRIAILDFDVHHGNGNEDIVRGHATRFVASSHQSPLFPLTGLAHGFVGKHKEILNVPLPPASGSEEFRKAWSRIILPAVVDYEPDMVFISAGFDAHAYDPLATLTLREKDFEWVTEAILKAAKGVPVVSVLEGGYDVDALERCVRTHVEALAGKESQ